MRKRRLWAGVIGAVIGWGIAGLDGGFADTVDIPSPRADFVASGVIVSSKLGKMPFDLARQGALVRQVIQVAGDRIEMLFDRQESLVTVVGPGKVSILPTHGATASLLDPFMRAERLADAPLQIVRNGLASHLGIPCEQFRATGTAAGEPLRATACVTSDGIPLVTAIVSNRVTVHTRITAIDFDPSELPSVEQPGRPAEAALTGG